MTLVGCLHYGWVRILASHTYTNSWSSFTSQPLHSSGLHRVYPAHAQHDPQPRMGRETACRRPGTLCRSLFFFFPLLPWPTHKFQTYYDPQTHFCLLNKIFNFVELHLYPFQPYMYSQVKRQSKPRDHFICFSSHTALRPCCQLYSVKMTVLIFCLVLLLSSVQFSHSVVSDSLQPHGLQHARPPCPSPTPGVYSNSCPLSRGCHPQVLWLYAVKRQIWFFLLYYGPLLFYSLNAISLSI